MKDLFGILYTVDELVNYAISLRAYGNLLLALACISALIIGAFKLLKGNKPDFSKLMLIAILCDFLRAWFVLSSIWAADKAPSGYNTSTLGHLGVFIFLSMQAVSIPKPTVDKKNKPISYVVPAIIGIPTLTVLFLGDRDITVFQRILFYIIAIILLYGIHNALKYILSTNTERKMNKTNIVIIVYAVASLLENYLFMIFVYTKPIVPIHIGLMLAFAVQAACVVALPIVNAKEVEQW